MWVRKEKINIGLDGLSSIWRTRAFSLRFSWDQAEHNRMHPLCCLLVVIRTVQLSLRHPNCMMINRALD
jgi:hypothetical protein